MQPAPVEWSEPRPYLDTTTSARLAAGANTNRPATAPQGYTRPFGAPASIADMPTTRTESNATRPEALKLETRKSSNFHPATQPLNMSRPSSADGQNALTPGSTLSVTSDSVQLPPLLSQRATADAMGLPPIGPPLPSLSSSRTSTPTTESCSRPFMGNPPDLPSPETNHLNLSTTTMAEAPALPLPANLVLGPPESATLAQRPWTGDPDPRRSSMAELWGPLERQYWTRRST